MAAEFAALLGRYRRRAGLSQSTLARLVHLTPSYVSRLEAGQRARPTRDTILGLGTNLDLDPLELDDLLEGAGYLPAGREFGSEDTTLRAVAGALLDPRLTPEARVDLRATIETLCARWATATTGRGGRRHLRALP